MFVLSLLEYATCAVADRKVCPNRWVIQGGKVTDLKKAGELRQRRSVRQLQLAGSGSVGNPVDNGGIRPR